MLKINIPSERLGRQNADTGKLLIVNGFKGENLKKVGHILNFLGHIFDFKARAFYCFLKKCRNLAAPSVISF